MFWFFISFIEPDLGLNPRLTPRNGHYRCHAPTSQDRRSSIALAVFLFTQTYLPEGGNDHLQRHTNIPVFPKPPFKRQIQMISFTYTYFLLAMFAIY